MASRLNLEIREVRQGHPSYDVFCQNWSGECSLTGPQVIEYTNEAFLQLVQVSREVNSDIEFALDPAQYNSEEYWNYPESGRGDCEDNALEKRRRLVKQGFPRAALRMTTAFHRDQYYAHALLLVETTAGTFVLDQDSEDVLLWDQAPYIYEARERVDGKWERFFQDW
jgi:predicted transglutaminase-like cysteine proteinase